MRKQIAVTILSMVVVSIVLTLAPIKTAYAGTKIFGLDITASYLNLKQKVMERIFGISFPQNVVDTKNAPGNIIVRGNGDDVDNQSSNPSYNSSKLDSFVKLTFTHKQVNDFIKSTFVDRSLGNNLTLKSGNLEFLDNNKINLTAELTNSVKAFATLEVVENGMSLKIESLDIENAGIGAKVLKPLVIKYFESHQKELIKKYAPADFAFIEVKASLVNVYMHKP